MRELVLTVAESDPRRVTAETLASDHPVRDRPLVGGEEVRGEEVDEERDVLGRPGCCATQRLVLACGDVAASRLADAGRLTLDGVHVDAVQGPIHQSVGCRLVADIE